MEISKVLEIAPAKISEYCESENKAYAIMLHKHEEYKSERAKKYLLMKAQQEGTAKEIDYNLDCDIDLCAIKNAEIQAEIDYRAFRCKKEKAINTFNSAMELGRTIRQEMRSLQDTIEK